MKNFKVLYVAGLLSVVCASPAMAAVSASANISSFTVSLYDLNPLDGVAPTITWSQPAYASYGNFTQAYVYDNSGYGSGGYVTNYSGLGSSNISTGSSSHASATASVAASSSALTPSGVVSASGSAYATASSGTTSFYGYAVDPYYYYNSFVLSANTAVVFTATAASQAATTVGYNSKTGQSESASATATLTVSGTGPSGTGYQSASDSVSSYASYVWGGYTYDPVAGGYSYNYLPQSASSSATLVGSFVNVSKGNLTGQLQVQAYANGYTSVVAVPEPETYAMLLAGLGMIGAVARRRQAC